MTHLLQARIEDDLWEQIQDAAQADRRSVASWVRLLIEDRLNGSWQSAVDGQTGVFSQGDSGWLVVHGVSCPKRPHTGEGYLHGEDDDTPYLVDGLRYCGRCHGSIDSASVAPEEEDQKARIARIKANPRVQERAAEIRARRKANQASVSQLEENRSPKPGDERSNRSRRAGKGSLASDPASRATAGGGRDRSLVRNPAESPSHKPVGDGITDDTEAVQALQDKPQRRRKSKACKHTNQIRKLGAAFCTDCGEFV